MDWLLSAPPALRWALTLAFAGVVIVLSITPGVERPDDTVFGWLVLNTATTLQKALHVVIYAVLALLWMWTLEPIQSRWLRGALTLAACVGMGALLEWHQTRVPGRFGSIADVLLNLAGAILGLAAAFLFLL